MQLISEDYKKQQQELHATGTYGTAAIQFGDVVSTLVDSLKIDTLLDYGCGSNRSLLKTLSPKRDILYIGYDPAIPEFCRKEPSDLVVCIDVLEHIEPNLLHNVLDDLMMLCNQYAFFTVHTGPAKKVLSDGRNAHLIQKPSAWWLEKLTKRWELLTFEKSNCGFNVFLETL